MPGVKVNAESEAGIRGALRDVARSRCRDRGQGPLLQPRGGEGSPCGRVFLFSVGARLAGDIALDPIIDGVSKIVTPVSWIYHNVTQVTVHNPLTIL